MADQQTKKWIQSPTELVTMAMFYTFGFVILKYIRRDKAPAKLRNVKLVYNAIMSIFSFYVFYGVLRLLIENYVNSNPRNQPFVCDGELELVEGMEWYFQIFYYSKYVEFIDTFFLVMAGVANLGMKMTLHFYHHLITPTICYSTWFYPCTGGWAGPLTNSFVHVIMYGYYGLSVLFPSIKKYGNLVTYVQLTQFIGVIMYHLWFVIPEALGGCACNTNQLLFNLGQYLIFLVLFFFFLICKNRSKAASLKEEKSNGHVTKTALTNGHTPNGNGLKSHKKE